MDEMIEQATLGTETAETGAEPSFQELIEGRYKEDYQRLRQQENDRRFAAHREQEARWSKWIPAMEKLCADRGLDADDAEGLTAALENVAESPERRGALREWAACRTLDGWVQEAMALREKYPAFDLKAELGDEGFAQRLKRGLTVREAYEAAHRDELMMSAMTATAQQVRMEMTAAMQARWERPREGGLARRAASATQADPGRMSRQDREALEKRALHGERIVM